MANAFQIQNAEYVEVYIPTGNTRTQIYFPDLPNLRNRPIVGMEAYTVLEQPISNSGYTVMAGTECQNSSITLYFDGGEFIVVPFTSIKRIDNGTNHATFGDIPNLAGQNIVWTKSYISCNGTIANYAAKTFLFNVYYKR
jgi:hypothetical protein